MNNELSNPPGKSLTKHILDLLKMAQEKGFPNYIEYYDPLEVKSWRHDEQVFCAVVCAAIQTWLRQKIKIDIWVVALTPGSTYDAYIRFYGAIRRAEEMNKAVDCSYEYQLINAVTQALNALPPAAQG